MPAPLVCVMLNRLPWQVAEGTRLTWDVILAEAEQLQPAISQVRGLRIIARHEDVICEVVPTTAIVAGRRAWFVEALPSLQLTVGAADIIDGQIGGEANG